MTTFPSVKTTSVNCRICNASAPFFGEAEVLKKYRVQYFRCQECGFIQTEEPYWLDEAYSSAIAGQDVGIMSRNLINCEVTSGVLNLLFPDSDNGVDFGGGHGVFVRLMRDRGFRFHWSDLHATNDYARGFESVDGARYDFLTAFEVLEHLTNPIEELSKLMSVSDNVLVSTCLVPEPTPRIQDWWYFVPTSGQHISFYTEKSLHFLAMRFNRFLLSAGPYHLFTRTPKSSILFGLLTRLKVARMVNFIYRRKSLIESDFDKMTK